MNRKAQEEIVGFVAIIIIVTILGIILLGFVIRNQSESQDKDNRDLLRFLESALVYTTNCTLDYGYSYRNVRDLTKLCYQKPDSECTSGEEACLVLNKTIEGLLEAGFGIVDNSTFVKGYAYTSTFSKNLSIGYEEKEFLKISKGICELSNFRSYSLPISNNPNIDARIKICLNN